MNGRPAIRAGQRGVQAQAGCGCGVVGDLGAMVRIEIDIRLARDDHVHAARHEQRTQSSGQGQRKILLCLSAKFCAWIVATVRGVEHDDKARRIRRG